MTNALSKGRFDIALDAIGVAVPAGAAAYAGWALGPLAGYQPALAAAAAGAATALPALLFMRRMTATSSGYALQAGDSDEHWVFGDLIAAAEIAPVVPTRPADDVLDLVDRWEDIRERDELVLDTPWGAVATELEELLLDRPMVAARTDELAELLLDDALPAAVADARVVQLFAPEQLRERVDRHLANARGIAAQVGDASDDDASDALAIALADLKRSLRRA